MKIAYITNAGPNSGVGHRAKEIKRLLKEMDVFEVDEFYLNGNKGILKKNGIFIFSIFLKRSISRSCF